MSTLLGRRICLPRLIHESATDILLMLLDDNWNLTKFLLYIYQSCLHFKPQLISISCLHFHDFKKIQVMTQCISFNFLFLIPFLTHLQFLGILLLLNKTWSASTINNLLESNISEMFPVRLGYWFWLYIVDQLFTKAQSHDDILTPYNSV